MLRVTVVAAAAAILYETIQAGREAHNLNKSVELLFELFKALDDASSVLDFEEVKNYKLMEPSQNDK
jgi:hypothetical protein